MSVVPALILSGTDYPDSVYHAHFAVKPSYFAEKIDRIGAFRPIFLIFFRQKTNKNVLLQLGLSGFHALPTNPSVFGQEKERNSAKRSGTDRLTRKKANKIGKTVRHGLFRFFNF